ncbi:LGFP repeat-containing protein [Kineococcus sp. SYSU DK002]|uniref:LGFP repeat-containing protein n=1 Tax=Kineococcus sp. SYSU DK002 TaxID=3383123 RepID=UPI003D7DB9A7
MVTPQKPQTPAPAPVRGNPVKNPDGTTTWTNPGGQKVVLRGDILARYEAQGSSGGTLGLPVTGEVAIPGGAFTHFENGSVYWSPAGGAHVVAGATRDAWAKAGWERGVGFPTGEAFAVKSSSGTPGTVQRFAGGLVYASAGQGHVVKGAIEGRYATLGWEGSRLGLPVTSEFGVRGGAASHFQGGSVYWSPATGAQPVWGAFRDLFAGQGWENGALGFPRSGEIPLAGGAVVQQYQGGELYWSAATGAHSVRGAFRATYAAGGFERGLGLPTTEEIPTATGVIQRFERGTLAWDRASGRVTRS